MTYDEARNRMCPSLVMQQAARIEAMEAELATARKDTKRLAWMIEDIMSRKVYVRDYDETTGVYTYICCGKKANTPRAAIDAAMDKDQK